MGYLKIVLVGNASSGKTALCLRYTADTFTDTIPETIGVDFKVKSCRPNSSTSVKLGLWDTAGAMRFRSLISPYLRDEDIIFVVFDLTQSKEEITNAVNIWLDMIQSGDPNHTPIMLVGTKQDKQDEIQITDEEINQLGTGHTCASSIVARVQVSSKTSSGVDALFESATHHIIQKNTANSKKEPEDEEVNPTFVMTAMAHPATKIAAIILMAASLILLGLITGGLVPAGTVATASGVGLASSGIGLFVANKVASKEPIFTLPCFAL